jgi:hypothetical protein
MSQLGDGTCDQRCNTVSCDFDQHDCSHNVTTLQDPSLELDDGAWETYNEGSYPILGSNRCCNTTALLRSKCHAIDGN